MKKIPSFCLLVLSTMIMAGQSGNVPKIAIKNVNIMNTKEGTLQPDQTVIIQNDKISEIGPTDSMEIKDGWKIIDGNDKYLIPGLWDSHVHLSYLGPEVLPVLVAHGITAVRDLGSILPEVHQWEKRIKDGQLLGPRIKATGYNIESGEWLDAANKIINSSDLLRSYGIFEAAPRLRVENSQDAQRAIDSLIDLGSDIIKFRNLKRENFIALAAYAEKKNIPLVGHSPKEITLGEAAKAGLASVEHSETILNSFQGMDSLQRLEEYQKIKEAGTMFSPTMIADYKTKLSTGEEMLEAITDTIGEKDPRNRLITPPLRKMWKFAYETRSLGSSTDWGPFFEKSEKLLKESAQSGVEFLAGTDLGVVLVYPGSSLHEEMILMQEELEMSPGEVLKSATLNPAKFFGMEDILGTVEAEKYADLVILSNNPLEDIKNVKEIDGVFLRGKFFSRTELDQILKSSEEDISNEIKN
ncbi:amidohydrolase family protein [Salinimicrobium terrae]|uniref:amidohydrolase family protein n=1 Tax=Salinimicrobium terrae TaxID=470866 RepID=UPI00041198AC|nr:amidohydrolase family protein [Salinimicrobium terrae]